MVSTLTQSSSTINPLNQLFTNVQTFVQHKQHQLFHSQNDSLHKHSSKLKLNKTQQRILSAQTYMDARLAGRNDDVLKLVSDNVVLTSSRDGRFEGKHNLKSYINRVKASGKWHKPTWNNTLHMAEVEGNVKILMINVPLLAQFAFDSRGKISTINVGTRKKLSSSTTTISN